MSEETVEEIENRLHECEVVKGHLEDLHWVVDKRLEKILNDTAAKIDFEIHNAKNMLLIRENQK